MNPDDGDDLTDDDLTDDDRAALHRALDRPKGRRAA